MSTVASTVTRREARSCSADQRCAVADEQAPASNARISDTVRGEGGPSTAWSIEEYGIEKFIWVKCVSTPSVGRTEPVRTAQVALSLRKRSEVSKMRAKEEGASDHPFHDEADR